MTSLILPESARYKHTIDLTRHHKVFSRGDIIVWMTWIQLTGRPAMVLTPKEAVINHERVIPCIIPIDMAYRWSREHWFEVDTIRQAQRFLSALGFNPHNKKTILKLLGIVNDYLPDLLAMPPMPEETSEIAAEALITDNATGKTVLKEIRDNA